MSNISRLTEQVKQDAKDSFKDFLLNTFLGDQYPQTNILHNYRTFNYNVTLAIVSAQEFKTGSYRTNGLDYILFQSHGKPANGRNYVRSGVKTLDSLQSIVGTFSNLSENKWDFYLQDLYIKSSFTAKRDIGAEFRLRIVEPYGMDTFIKAITKGLAVKGYKDFGRANAFVLKIEFVGYKDDKETPEVIPYSTRHYPIIISEFKADVTEKGTVYEIIGAPLNDTGRYNDLNVIPQDFSLSGPTVKDILVGEKGLLKFLNQTPKKGKEDVEFKPVEYDIAFLDDDGRPSENGGEIISKILASKMYNPNTDAGQVAFKVPKNEYIEVKGLAENLAENKEITFNVSGKIGIAKMIDSLITESYYVKEKIVKNFQGEFLKDGMVGWWRVVPKVEITGFDDKKNMPTFKVTFMVSPRRVPWQKLASIFFPDTKAEPEDYERFCTRRYEWNYTGNNRDVLNFKINYDQLLVRTLAANLGKMALDSNALKPSQGASQQAIEAKAGAVTVPTIQETKQAVVGAITGNKTVESTEQRSTARVSSSTETSADANLARDISALLNNPTENVNVEMEILGDPMWLGTQFIDNLSFIDPAKSDLYTNDGGIAMRTIDPCIRVIAYAPSDFNSDGYLSTSGLSDQDKRVSDFSAYYMIFEIENFFSDGVFKQKIKGYRLTDTDMKKAAKLASPLDIFGFKKMGSVI